MDYRKILILRLSAVGDVIRTLPAVKVLKEYYPSSQIAWIVEEPSRSLLESQLEIDEVILFPRKRWTEGLKSPRRIWKTLWEMGKFILDLRKQKFNVSLDFHGILKSGLLSFLSGAPKRVGFDRKSSKEGNSLFSNLKVNLPQEKISRFHKNLVLLRGIGLEIKNCSPGLHIAPEDREYVDSFLSSLTPFPKRPWIAIHPGTSAKTSFKRWMPDRYSQLADRLIHELQATVIFTWGPGELILVENIQKGMKESSIVGPTTQSLTQLAEVLRRCNLYIGGDTGPMYIASLVGIPLVVVYGPTDPILYEPFGLHRKVMKEVGCNPCYPYRKRSCNKIDCLRAIGVEDVFEAAKEMLSISH